jgi:hypothetical protein
MRSTEHDVADAVLQVLAKYPSGEAPIGAIVKGIPDYLKLTDEDRTPSKTRPNEELWEQQVRNITSHKASPGNFIYEGFLEQVKGGLKITEAGRLRLKHKGLHP